MRFSGQEVNAALGTFFQTFEGVKQIMTERAQKKAWAEAQPQITAQLQQLYGPLQQADEEAKAAKTPEERQAAIGRRMQLSRDFAMGAMDLGARLAASGNPQAQAYAKQLQDSVGQAVQMEMQGAQMRFQMESQTMQREHDQMREGIEDRRYEAEKSHALEREGVQDDRYAQDQERLAAKDKLEAENQRGDNARADEQLGLARQGVEADKARATEEARRYDEGKIFRAGELLDQLGKAGVSEEVIAKSVREASGGKLDLSELLEKKKAVDTRNQAELKELEGSMKMLEETKRDPDLLGEMKQRYDELQTQAVDRMRERFQRNKPKAKGAASGGLSSVTDHVREGSAIDELSKIVAEMMASPGLEKPLTPLDRR